MEKAKTMTAQMAESRAAFNEVVKGLEVAGFEFRGVTEKGMLFSDEQDHFVTVSVTAHKWESETAEGYDGYGMLEQYEQKQLEKAEKTKEKEALKAKKIAEKAKKTAEKASKSAENSEKTE